MVGFRPEHHEHAFDLLAGLLMPNEGHLVGQVINVIVVRRAFDLEDNDFVAQGDEVNFPFLARTEDYAFGVLDDLPQHHVLRLDVRALKFVAEGAGHDFFPGAALRRRNPARLSSIQSCQPGFPA